MLKPSNRITIYHEMGHLVQRFGLGSIQTQVLPSNRDRIGSSASSSQGSHHVRSFELGPNPIQMNIGPGLSKVKDLDIPLPQTVIPSSILLLDEAGQILPFTYHSPPTTPTHTITVCKNDHLITGELVTLDDDNVTLIADQKLTVIREYDRIRMEQPVASKSAHISLVPPTHPFSLSFLLSELQWKCVGTALIDTHNDNILLRLTGQILNSTQQILEGVVVLVSGQLQTGKLPLVNRSEAKMMRAAMAAPIEIEPVAVSDYVRYDVGECQLGSEALAELGLLSLPVTKIYFHGTESGNRVRFGYRCAPQRYLPAASLDIYSIDAQGGIDSYLGSSSIPESRFRSDLDLILGGTTTLQCTTLLERSDSLMKNPSTYNLIDGPDQKWHRVTTTVRTEVLNFNQNIVLLSIQHQINQDRILKVIGPDYATRTPTHLEWIFQIPPGDAKNEAEPYRTRFEVEIVTAIQY